jgi:hypothetical protein
MKKMIIAISGKNGKRSFPFWQGKRIWKAKTM